MCDLVGGTMAAISIYGAYKGMEAEQEKGKAINKAAVQSAALQNEAYTHDMSQYHGENVAIQIQKFQNAEDAADAKLDLAIRKKETTSSLSLMQLEGTASNVPGRQVGMIKRQFADQANDIDRNLKRGMINLKGQAKKLEHDQYARWNSARGAVNSIPRADFQSYESKVGQLLTSGFGSYAKYSTPSAKGSKGSKTTSPTNVSNPLGYT